LKKRNNAPVIIIWHGRRGILSAIVAKFSDVRAATKNKRKTLNEAYSAVELKIQKFQMIQNAKRRRIVKKPPPPPKPIEQEVKKQKIIEEQPVLAFGFDSDEDNDTLVESQEQTIVEPVAFGFELESDDDECTASIKTPTPEPLAFGFDDFDEDNSNMSFTQSEAPIENIAFGFDEDSCDQNEMQIQTNTNVDICFGFDEDDDCEPSIEQANVVIETPVQQEVNVEKEQRDTMDDINDRIFDNNENQLEFDFVEKYSKYIAVLSNGYVMFNDQLLETEDEPIKILQGIKADISREVAIVGNSYELQKSVVSSIYGCVGKMIRVIAAGITCITRSTLLASAQYCRSLGHKVLYIDTDSIMISGCNVDLSPDLNRMYPFLEMEMKVAQKCMFVKRKTYYKLEENCLKYGQHVNGPLAWNEFVHFIYNENKICTNNDIVKVFHKFFLHIYKKLFSYSQVSDFVKYITQTIKVKESYKTSTVSAKFKEYMSMKYPAIAGATKHDVYYHIDETVLFPCLRPVLDIKHISDLKNVNLFKFYQNMFATVCNIIKFNIKENNRPFNVTVSSDHILLLMLKGFLDAYEDVYKRKIFEQKTIDTAIEQSNAQLVIDDPIYEETVHQGIIVA
jgi:hypothetical protein